MSRLEELIQEYCPNGVEYKTISDISIVSIGEFVHKNKQTPNGKYPVYNGGISNTGYYTEYNRTANKIIISARGANAGFVNRVFCNYWSGNSCYSIEIIDENTNWNYVYYWLKNNERKLLDDQQKGGIPAVSKKQVAKTIIALPPIPVQEEIVRILDCFTQLTAELQAELALQKQRFSYYKDIIIENIDKKYYVPLSTIAKQERGKNKGQRITDAFSVTQKGIIRTTDYFGENTKITSNNTSNYYILKPGWFAYSPSRINVGSFNYLRVNHDVIISPLNKVFSVDTDKIVPEFLYQYMTSTTGFSKMLRFREGIEGTGRWHLEFDDMAKMEIPLIPVEKQNKIIDALKNFDVLCNDTLFGLPAEIQARQKQYEYYRDKLLTFPPLS